MKSPWILPASPLARVARLVLRAPNVAMVLGNTIHLSGVTRAEFLRDPYWVAHEMCHIRQFQEHGFLPFLWKYFAESVRLGFRNRGFSVRGGYYANRFEAEAREAGRREAHLYANGLPLPDPATLHQGVGPQA